MSHRLTRPAPSDITKRSLPASLIIHALIAASLADALSAAVDAFGIGPAGKRDLLLASLIPSVDRFRRLFPRLGRAR
jgi:hypothetical protein